MTDTYVPRVIDARLDGRLRSIGAVLIEGPRACGKTVTAARKSASAFYFDRDAGARSLVSSSPATLFAGDTPILLDEWQMEPSLWNLVRHEVDDRGPARGLFILTGSARPPDDVRRHSGAGRFARMRMRPMSLFELGVSTGQASLRDIFDDDFISSLDPGVTVPSLIDHIVIGGWPNLMGADVHEATTWLHDYLQTIVEVDLPQAGARRDPPSLLRLLAGLGRGVGTEVTVTSLAKDVGGVDGPADPDAIRGYLTTLERMMVLDDVPAWATHMRSTSTLRKSPTRYLADPSLGLAALRAGPKQLLYDLNAAGFHFEAMVVRDLRVYVDPLDGWISHWRDNSGHEVDVIVTLADGRWAALEVKMNPDHVDRAADALKRFSAKVDTTKIGEPAFLAVITTRTHALRRPDGVLVLPIAALGP